MKLAQLFARRKSPAPQRRRAPSAELIGRWTTRDWADLPVHHPRAD